MLAIKALIRYHFGEWEYHSKLGDGSIEELFFRDPNPFLKINPQQSAIDREDIVMSCVYDIVNRAPQISIITAFGRDIYNYAPMTPVASAGSAILFEARKALKERNHFLVEAEYIDQLRPIVPYITETLRAGTRWHRARQGIKKRSASITHAGAPLDYAYQPHDKVDIGAPPIVIASAGRANRPGVSYLYLASDLATAAAEIRPHPGELVSVGNFELVRDLRVADIRAHDLTKLWRSDGELELLELIATIEDVFSTAAPPSNRSTYTVTQFLAEILRQLGFDGIVFRSTVGDGYNLVIFDPSAADWVEGSSKVIDVKRVTYETVDRPLFDPMAHYDFTFEH
ncbi:RES family NAD+ phosphorylase [Dyella sp. EPa41]|uniref:RES family NAD+ phosphorylase n=1 Tax=Dyella sp. EPa41 TaxID=1561194 RepID=UPI00191640AC|nr:RES family NAD+ phosphorylase [Dyella sp. EPa41]